MSTYFDYQNPPPSRDTQADLDRIQEHFARLSALRCEGCNCRKGERETKDGRLCRMTVEIANGNQ